jgi:hypothetical protein
MQIKIKKIVFHYLHSCEADVSGKKSNAIYNLCFHICSYTKNLVIKKMYKKRKKKKTTKNITNKELN